MSNSPTTQLPKVFLRLRKNSAGEWSLAPRREVDIDTPGASDSPQAAEDTAGSNDVEDVQITSPVKLDRPKRKPPRTPASVPHSGALASAPLQPKSILKRSESVSQPENSSSPDKPLEKNVRILSDPEVKFITPTESSPPNRLVSPPSSEDALDIVASSSRPGNMSESQRPKLKLSLKSTGNFPQDSGSTPSSAVARTPSTTIRLNINKNKAISSPVVKAEQNGTPESTTKKRKRTQKAIEADNSVSSEDEGGSFKKPGLPVRRLTIKHQAPKPAQNQTPTSGVPAIRLKYKGKLPKRPLGVGYDSENEETEKDPVILEGFILRMQPGPDAEYVRKAIADGTVGVPRASGGADIQIRLLDTHGRRGVVVVRQQRYASSLVDLPCVIEGMKSWDRKGWIKSIDVCQMLLVLGKCNTDDEAKTYPLPVEVDPKTWQYAHGLTVPMRWVRKRRFNRTKRARVDDIEAVERRVRALLEADEAADSSTYTLHDHDPREDNEPGEESGEYETDSGVEGSEEAEARDTPAHYFAMQSGQRNRAESPQDDVDEDTLAQMFDDEDADDSRLPASQHDHLKASGHPQEEGSSFVVTSASGSPSAAAQTPASAADEDSGDEDEEDDEEEESADEAEEEGDENRQQALDRIADMKKKIAEQTEVMKATDNAILKKKIAGKITSLKADVEQMRRAAGLESEEED